MGDNGTMTTSELRQTAKLLREPMGEEAPPKDLMLADVCETLAQVIESADPANDLEPAYEEGIDTWSLAKTQGWNAAMMAVRAIIEGKS